AVIDVRGVVVAANAGRVARAGAAEGTRRGVQLGSVADTDLQALEARREVVDAVDVLPLRRDRRRHRTAVGLVVGNDGRVGPVVVVLDGAPTDQRGRRAVIHTVRSSVAGAHLDTTPVAEGEEEGFVDLRVGSRR